MWEKIPGSPRFTVLEATESWAGSGYKAREMQQLLHIVRDENWARVLGIKVEGAQAGNITISAIIEEEKWGREEGRKEETMCMRVQQGDIAVRLVLCWPSSEQISFWTHHTSNAYFMSIPHDMRLVPRLHGNETRLLPSYWSTTRETYHQKPNQKSNLHV